MLIDRLGLRRAGMDELQVPPEPQLLESMRAVGYTIETSIADLVDNSIAADAKNIDVLFASEPEPYVAILDDGVGMSEVEAIRAMKLAGTGALVDRSAADLGRFGLGLKTASLAQCRCVTLVSKRRGTEAVAFRWDLDHLRQVGRWSLQRLSPSEMSMLPRFAALDERACGTLVVWQNLDQFVASHGTGPDALNKGMQQVRSHLSLVFHRFLARKGETQVRISTNYNPIQAADPFLLKNPYTCKEGEEVFEVGGERIHVTAYTLPYLNRLTNAEKESAQLGSTLRDSQGFYVYRGERLVIWGTWFKLMKRSETAKLARVQVDIPNTLDGEWSLDIKKSSALPPPEVLDRLGILARRFTEGSKKTTEFRGRPRVDKAGAIRMWELVEDRDGFRYEINMQHPLVVEHLRRGDAMSLRELIVALQTTAPFNDAHLRIARDERFNENVMADDELTTIAKSMWDVMNHSTTPEHFVVTFAKTEPFLGHPFAKKILEGVTR